MEPSRILTPATIEQLIANGNIIVICDGRALKLDYWLDQHPGGRLAVLHMVGRDATNEIEIYHSPATLLQMHRYCIGHIQEPWVNFTPPIRGGVFRKEPLAVTEVQSSSAAATKSSTSIERSPRSAPATPQCLDPVRHHSPVRLVQRRSAKEASDRTAHVTLPVPSDKPKAKDDVMMHQLHETVGEYISQALQEEISTNTTDYPSLDVETQGEINRKYRELHERVSREGFYDCRYTQYGKELIRYTFLFALSMTALSYEWYLTSAAFLGLFWHQIMFTAHDAGHRGITHNFVIDTLLGMFIADFCCGLSIGWWKSSHNVHHLITNHPEHDPDIQNVPLFATSLSFFKSLRSTYYGITFVWDAFASLAVKYQVYTYYPVMTIARFNLYYLSIYHLLSSKSKVKGKIAWIRPTELSFIACYWFLFGYLLLWRSIPTWPLRIAFVLISHIITTPLHVQITLSHWGMSTADLGESESFSQRQLRTTMDVECPAWMDFIHGGLQFQAIHHLFPRVPRHNLRDLRVLVQQFCKETGIPYHVLGFVDGNRKVLSRLTEVSRHVAILVECQRHLAETGETHIG